MKDEDVDILWQVASLALPLLCWIPARKTKWGRDLTFAEDSLITTVIALVAILVVLLRTKKRQQQQQQRRGWIVALEGNIAAGKSFIGRHLEGTKWQGQQSVRVVFERISNSLLRLFYTEEPEHRRERPRYPFTLQLNTLSRRLDAFWHAQHEQQLDPLSICILDRSILGDFVFASKHYLDGKISDEEVKVYFEECQMKSLGQFLLQELDVIVYLHSTPERCRASLAKRGQVDQDVKEDYLNVIDNLHIYGVWWLKLRFPQLRICVLDWRTFGNPADVLSRGLDEAGHGSLTVVQQNELEAKQHTIMTGNEDKEFSAEAIAKLPQHIYVRYETTLQRMHDEALFNLPNIKRRVHSQAFKNLVMGALAQGKHVTLVRQNKDMECLLDWFDTGLQQFMPHA